MNALRRLKCLLHGDAVGAVITILIAIISLGKTAGYYFYGDDFALIYHLQHATPYAWPYVFLEEFFSPLYKVFGMNHDAFFVLSLAAYTVSSLLLFCLVRVITKNRLLAWLSAWIFATGYVAIDQFSEVVSSLMSFHTALVLCSMLSYLLWLERKKIKFYLLSLFVVFIDVLLVPTRTLPIALILPTIDVIMTTKSSSGAMRWRAISLAILRSVPVEIIVFADMIVGNKLIAGSGQVTTTAGVLSNFLETFRYQNVQEYFSILGRIFVWPPVQAVLMAKGVPDLSMYAGIALIIVSGLIVYGLHKNRRGEREALGIVIGMAIILEGYTPFFVYGPAFDTGGVICRYLTMSAIGYAIFVPSCIFAVFKITPRLSRHRFNLLYTAGICCVIIYIAAVSSRGYEDVVRRDYSIPARHFFRDLQSFVPYVQGESIFYFSVAKYQPDAYHFSNVLLNAYMTKDVMLAAYYHVKTADIHIILNNFDAAVNMRKALPNARFYAFYADDTGLTDITRQIEDYFIGNDTTSTVSQIYAKSTGLHPNISVPLPKISSVTPLHVTVSLRISPLDPTIVLKQADAQTRQDTAVNQLVQYALWEQTARRHIVVSSPRYYADENFARTPNLMIDGDLSTSWLDAADWAPGSPAQVTIDRGTDESFNRLVWYVDSRRVPKKYSLYVSDDGLSWTPIYATESKNSVEDRTMIINTFPPQQSRYIKLIIRSTISNIATDENLAPSISEILPIATDESGIDLLKAHEFVMYPFAYVRTVDDVMNLYTYEQEVGKIGFRLLTNADSDIQNVRAVYTPLFADGVYHDYSISATPSGTIARSLNVTVPFPATIEISDISLLKEKTSR